MSNINRVEFTGRLIKDFDLKATTNNQLATSCIAVRGASNKKQKDRVTQQETKWYADGLFNLTIWSELGEEAASKFHKGDTVVVIGAAKLDSYINKETQKEATSFNLVVSEIRLLDDEDTAPATTPTEAAAKPAARTSARSAPQEFDPFADE